MVQHISNEIGTVRDSLKAKPQGIASDQDKGPADYDLPAATTSGVLSAAEGSKVDAEKSDDQPENEDDRYWKIVGWAPRFGDGLPADLDMNTNLLDQSTWVEGKLEDKFFGGKSHSCEHD